MSDIRFTPKQLQILEFIVRFTSERGVSPTLEEIAESALDKPVTKITVYEHINQLETKGAVKREKFKARSITVLVDLPTRANNARARFEAFLEALEKDGYKIGRDNAHGCVFSLPGELPAGEVYFAFDDEGKLEKISA
jgi:SOS-response transcriptional repressor LexA